MLSEDGLDRGSISFLDFASAVGTLHRRDGDSASLLYAIYAMSPTRRNTLHIDDVFEVLAAAPGCVPSEELMNMVRAPFLQLCVHITYIGTMLGDLVGRASF